MRDLRKVGWKIRTYRDMGSLKPSELFLERIGDHVWEPGYKWPKRELACNQAPCFRTGRSAVHGVWDRLWRRISDSPGVIARGTMGHIIPKERGGSLTDITNIRPECQLCNEAAKEFLTEMPADIELLKRRVRQLGRADKQQLFEWMSSEKRTFTPKEDLWAQYS